MTTITKLAAIRKQMKDDGVTAYIIPLSDPHISEYLPAHFQIVQAVSGFSGSAGTLVILAEQAHLWTDSRYFLQAEQELHNSGFQLMKLGLQHAPEYTSWLVANLPANAVIGFDGNLLAAQLAINLQEKLAGLSLKLVQRDYITPIWQNRPDLPSGKAYLLTEAAVGESTSSKLERVKPALSAKKASHLLLSALDDIAWLFNLRGQDIPCNPVVLAYALIGPNQIQLFLAEDKLSESESNSLAKAGVTLNPYTAISSALKSLKPTDTLLLDPWRNSYALLTTVPQSVSIVKEISPTTHFKSIKNEVELKHIRQTMIYDGVALTRFFKWLEEALQNNSEITEQSASERLYEFRKAQPGFVGNSFDTISAYADHAALPHYQAALKHSAVLKKTGLFLIDSGGQYKPESTTKTGGTTDITRVICLGKPSEQEKRDYTLVLKAMIEGVTAVFLKGSKGYHIDALTRKPLLDNDCDYGHGTGHGVGFFLNVHEGPHVFSPANIAIPIELNTITSIEPGIYRPGKHGIRIENLVRTIANPSESVFGTFYTFEVLSLCFIDTHLVNPDFLDAKHLRWLTNYNTLVSDKLKPYLTTEENNWLKERIAFDTSCLSQTA